MAKLVAVIACPSGIAQTYMAAEALRRAAAEKGHTLKIETQSNVSGSTLSAADIAAADAVILSIDGRIDEGRFTGKRILRATTQQTIRDAAGVLEELGDAPAPLQPTFPSTATTPGSDAGLSGAGLSDVDLSIVGVTSCPTGIAHTFMAAEGLESGARTLGYRAKIETQGSVGAGNQLTAADIAAADLVVIAADTNVDRARFEGKRVYVTGTKPAIKDGAGLIRTALEQASVQGGAAPGETQGSLSASNLAEQAATAKAEKNAGAPDFYKHLMTGVSHMLPFVVAGGLLIALGFAFGGITPAPESFGGVLKSIGGDAAFKLFIPVLAGYIAFSVADRPGLAPGMIGGYLAMTGGSGFLGGLAAGFIAGYLTRWLNQAIRLPRTLEGLKPTLLLPLLGTLFTGLLMVYAVGKPVKAILDAATAWLQGLGQSSAAALGAVIGGMMAFDMGGPINKAAYTFGVGLQASHVNGPIAAAMAAGMTPPLALFFATLLFKNRFTPDEQEAGKAAGVLGLAFITEGAIPFAARDPLRVIPAMVVGSAVAGAISMASGCLLAAPHGGVFVLAIPGAVTNLPMYIVAIVVGTVISTALLGVLKRPIITSKE